MYSPGMGSIKEQVYIEQLTQLKNQLQTLIAGVNGDYLKRLEQLKRDYDKDLAFFELCRKQDVERIERDCENEKTAAVREFEEKRAELRDSLISELEERRRQIEHEYQTMELTNDNVEVKPMKTRNLRRRYNDPVPATDAKRQLRAKSSPTLNLTLAETDIELDLQLIASALPPKLTSENGNSSGVADLPKHERNSTSSAETSGSTSATVGTDSARSSCNEDVVEVSIDNGKLIYQKKNFTKGQSVQVETVDGGKVTGVIQTIGGKEVTLRTSNGKKMHISLSQMQQGKCLLWRRAV